MQVKTSVGYHFIRMVSKKKIQNNRCWQGCGETETLAHCSWEYKMVQPLWKKYSSSLAEKLKNYHMVSCWKVMDRILTTDFPRLDAGNRSSCPCPCPLAFPNIPPAFPNLEAAPRTQPWDSSRLLRTSMDMQVNENVTASVQIFKTQNAGICSSSHRRDSNIRKTPLVIKTTAYQLAPIRLFLGSLLCILWDQFQILPQKVLRLPTPAIPLLAFAWEDRNGDSWACTWEERNLPTETYRDWFPINTWLQKTETHLLTINTCQKSFPVLKSVNSLLGLRIGHLRFAFLAHGYNPPQTLNDLLPVVQHAFTGSLIPLLFLKKKKKKTWFLLFWACLSKLLYLSSQVRIQRNWKQGLNGRFVQRRL